MTTIEIALRGAAKLQLLDGVHWRLSVPSNPLEQSSGDQCSRCTRAGRKDISRADTWVVVPSRAAALGQGGAWGVLAAAVYDRPGEWTSWLPTSRSGIGSLADALCRDLFGSVAHQDLLDLETDALHAEGYHHVTLVGRAYGVPVSKKTFKLGGILSSVSSVVPTVEVHVRRRGVSFVMVCAAGLLLDGQSNELAVDGAARVLLNRWIEATGSFQGSLLRCLDAVRESDPPLRTEESGDCRSWVSIALDQETVPREYRDSPGVKRLGPAVQFWKLNNRTLGDGLMVLLSK